MIDILSITHQAPDNRRPSTHSAHGVGDARRHLHHWSDPSHAGTTSPRKYPEGPRETGWSRGWSSSTGWARRVYRINTNHLAAEPIRELERPTSTFFTRLAQHLEGWQEPPVHAAVFASAARSTMTLHSDVDIFLVRDDNSPDTSWSDQVGGLVTSVTGWKGNDAHVVQLRVTPRKPEHADHPHSPDLTGTLKVRRSGRRLKSAMVGPSTHRASDAEVSSDSSCRWGFDPQRGNRSRRLATAHSGTAARCTEVPYLRRPAATLELPAVRLDDGRHAMDSAAAPTRPVTGA